MYLARYLVQKSYYNNIIKRYYNNNIERKEPVVGGVVLGEVPGAKKLL